MMLYAAICGDICGALSFIYGRYLSRRLPEVALVIFDAFGMWVHSIDKFARHQMLQFLRSYSILYGLDLGIISIVGYGRH